MRNAYATLPVRLAEASLLSLDVFDTVLLRDSSTETQRLAEAATRAARVLGIDPMALRALRWDAQQAAYRAVTLTDPQGEASLRTICALLSRTIGLDSRAADVMREVEVDLDIAHLRPNRRMLDVITAAKAAGLRVIATSDTYYSSEDLKRMFDAVLGANPFDEIYVSSELNRTKHAGGIFEVISEREHVAPSSVLHIGDHPTADKRNASRAGWRAVQIPRGGSHRAQKFLGSLAAVPARRARSR